MSDECLSDQGLFFVLDGKPVCVFIVQPWGVQVCFFWPEQQRTISVIQPCGLLPQWFMLTGQKTLKKFSVCSLIPITTHPLFHPAALTLALAHHSLNFVLRSVYDLYLCLDVWIESSVLCLKIVTLVRFNQSFYFYFVIFKSSWQVVHFSKEHELMPIMKL